MVDIPALVRTAVQTIESVAGSIRVTVQHTAIIGKTAFGPIYAPTPTPVLAMMEVTSEKVSGQDGAEKVSGAVFTFFEPIAIQERERFVVDGITHVVIKVGGLVDPLTQKVFNPQVWTRGSF